MGHVGDMTISDHVHRQLLWSLLVHLLLAQLRCCAIARSDNQFGRAQAVGSAGSVGKRSIELVPSGSNEAKASSSIRSPYFTEVHDLGAANNLEAPGNGQTQQESLLLAEQQVYNSRPIGEQQQNYGLPPTAGPLMLADSTTLIDPATAAAAGVVIQPAQTYSQPVADQAILGNPQVLASLYIDQFGNQRLSVPRNQKQLGQSLRGDGSSSGRIHTTESANNFYDTQQAPSVAQPNQNLYYAPGASPNMLISGHYETQPVGQGSRMVLGQGQEALLPQLASSLTLQPALDQSQQAGESKTLSNDQLLGLINELKEYNGRQKVNGDNRDQESKQAQSEDDDDDADDNDSDAASVAVVKDNQNSAAKEGQRLAGAKLATKRAGPKSGPAKPSTKELERFAQFLMTKEGANMRFQLGLDRESPDDGDEDERDSLLESKTKQSKTKPKDKSKPAAASELDELERKHSDVASQMDKLLESLSGALGKAEGEGEGEEEKSKRRNSRGQDSMDERKARARRDSRANDRLAQGSGSSSSKATTRIIVEDIPPSESTASQLSGKRGAKLEKGHGDNFAKQLLEQELSQDKQESLLRAAGSPNGKQIGGDIAEKSKKCRSSGRDLIEVSGGSQNDPYLSSERNVDRMALARELKKMRRNRGSTRLRDPLRGNPIVGQASNGNLAFQTERLPDGNLSLKRGEKGQSVTIKIPRTPVGDALNSGEDSSADNYGQSSPDVRSNRSLLSHVEINSDQNGLPSEYPVSERVNSRLNELSHNLDRYFNDGFLKEVTGRGLPSRGRDDSHQTGASSVDQREADRSGEASNEVKGPERKRDQDFDVNVGVDGKRDANEDYADEDEGDEDEGEGKAADASKEIKEKPKSMTGKNGSPKEKKREDSATEAGPSKRLDNETVSGSVKQDMSAANEQLVFESRVNPAKQATVLDPVDGESFDSPIGPDGDRSEYSAKIPKAARKNIKSASESRRLDTRIGKSLPKFFEESEW